MTKAGAIAILTTIFLGLSGWTMSEIATLKERTASLENEKETTKEMLKEIRADVKELLKK